MEAVQEAAVLVNKMNVGSTLLECKNITKRYGSGANASTVLNNVSFKIKSGEFVAIIGPSGSGKSTLMNIIGALDSPSSGEYILDNKLISSLEDDELALIRSQKIGFVFQSFNLLPRATASRNVNLPLIYNQTITKKDRISLVKRSLESAGFDLNLSNNKSNQLSGGQMQRVAIARALVNNPSIVLADEPTGNLDQTTGKIVLKTFIKLNQSGRTIILITHDPQVANYASRIIRIEDGHIIKDEINSDKRKNLL